MELVWCSPEHVATNNVEFCGAARGQRFYVVGLGVRHKVTIVVNFSLHSSHTLYDLPILQIPASKEAITSGFYKNYGNLRLQD